MQKNELDWWITNANDMKYDLLREEPSVHMTTDASTSGGWGAVCQSESSGGRWSPEEKSFHINVLELLAVEYGLKSFQSVLYGKHVKVLSDNQCAVTYLKNMGGSHSQVCNAVANWVWKWCKKNKVWLTVSYIPGKQNIQADLWSRKFKDDTEWMLSRKVFKNITAIWGNPKVDLFASWLNCQIKPFVSWHPDPEASAVDAFTIVWKEDLHYAFPPFSLIQAVIRKLEEDEAEIILILPNWPIACWFP